MELPPVWASWELVPQSCGVRLVLPRQDVICMYPQMVFLWGRGEGMVSFIPLARRGDRLILPLKMV